MKKKISGFAKAAAGLAAALGLMPATAFGAANTALEADEVLGGAQYDHMGIFILIAIGTAVIATMIAAGDAKADDYAQKDPKRHSALQN